MCLLYLEQGSMTVFLEVNSLQNITITPFRFDWNGSGGGILIYVRDDIPTKVIH